MFKSRHNYPFCSLKHSVGYLPYTENSRAIKVKDVTALLHCQVSRNWRWWHKLQDKFNDWHFSPTFHYGSGKIVVLNWRNNCSVKCHIILLLTWLNNILPSTKKYLERLTGICDIERFNLMDDTSIAGPDLTWLFKSICCCKCYSSWRFLKQLFKPSEYASWKLSFSHTKKPKRQVGWFWSHILSFH